MGVPVFWVYSRLDQFMEQSIIRHIVKFSGLVREELDAQETTATGPTVAARVAEKESFKKCVQGLIETF